MGPVYRAHIRIVPPFRSMLLISYWGRPKTISESVKRILPRMFYYLGILGLPPLLIKSPEFLGTAITARVMDLDTRDPLLRL